VRIDVQFVTDVSTNYIKTYIYSITGIVSSNNDSVMLSYERNSAVLYVNS